MTAGRPDLALVETAPVWPGRMLDVAGLRARGWRPTPFRDFVLKVHQRCNLACDYCFVYQMDDQTWRERPSVMPPEVWRTAAARIGEHVRVHGLDRVRIVLHGGEPLLAGRDRLRTLARDVQAALPASCSTVVCVQTNATLLDEATLQALHGDGFAIGVSLDGTPADQDRHRRTRDGRGSAAAVDRALRLLSSDRYRSAFAGLLAAVDLEADPVACYEGLLAYSPPTVDFLLPHANWVRPPVGPARAYGDWLVAAFDRWYDAPRQEVRVRLFDDVLSLALGGQSRSEQVGLSPVGVVVIESDGSIEQVDSLKSAYPRAAATGLTVREHPLDAALAHTGVVARQIGRAALCDTCLACPVHRVCGGGHYAHRYRVETGFRSPSVYCEGMRRFVEHALARVSADIAARLRSN